MKNLYLSFAKYISDYGKKSILLALTLVFAANFSGIHAQCPLNSSAFGNVAALSTVGTVNIATNQWRSEYATVTNIRCGYTYTFNSSVGNTSIVLTTNPTSNIIRWGENNVQWQANYSGTIYVHYRVLNTNCPTENASFTSSVTTNAVQSEGYEVAQETNPLFTAASGCSNGQIRVGAGAWRDITLATNTWYNWEAPGSFNGDLNALRIRPTNGGASEVTLGAGGSSTAWFSGTTTNVRVSTNRVLASSCWTGLSTILTYRHTQPDAAIATVATTPICSPNTTTVSGGGGANGILYWQGTTSGGTSTATTANPQTVSASGTYYWRSGNNGCWGTQGAATLVVNTAPSNLNYTNNGPLTYCAAQGITTNSASVSGTTPITYSVSPALPAGLSFNTSTGAITGTPTTTAGVPGANYTVTATNSCGSTTRVLNITIAPAAPSNLNYTNNGPLTYCAGVAIATNSASTSGGGAPTSYSVSPALPAGLSLNTSNGAITGTPTTTAGVAAANYTITASNSCGSTDRVLNITISPAAPSNLNYTNNGPLTYCASVAITANSASTSGGAPTSYSISPALPAGLSFNTSTGQITGTPSSTAGVPAANYTVTATNSCGSTQRVLNITISPAAPAALSYTDNGPIVYCANVGIATNNPSNTGGAPTSYSVSPALPAGLSLNTSNGQITGTPTTTAGVPAANYTITATNSCGSTQRVLNITISPAAPSGLSYTNNGPITYCANQAIASNTASTSGGAPTSYSVSPALPAGLSLNTTTGTITGTPTNTNGLAAANYTVTASNSCGSTDRVLNIAISPAAPTGLNYTNNGPLTYCANQAIAANNASTSGGGAPTSYSVSPALPAGLSFNTSTGQITGTPSTTAGVPAADYTVSAINSCGSTQRVLNITISPAAPSGLSYTNNGPITYCANQAIAANNASTSGGGAPTSYSVSPALPAGLSLNTSTGQITGTPTNINGLAAANYTITATNSCGSTDRVLNIAISPATPSGLSYTNNGPLTYCAGVAISANNASTSGGGAPTSYSVSPALPAGLSFNTSTGQITGTPSTTAGVPAADYTVSAINSCGSTTRILNITISPAAPSGLSYTNNGPLTYCANQAITANNASTSGGGAPTSYSVSPALPAGLSLNTSTGQITGTPTTITGVAAADYTILAINSCGSTPRVLNIAISPAAPTGLSYTDNGPLTYCVGVAITANNASTSGGGAPTSYSVSPALPAGLSLNTSTGQITGTPTTTAGVPATNYTVTASNSCGNTTRMLNIAIRPNIILSGVTQSSTVCAGNTATINLSGLVPSQTFTVAYTINGVPQTSATVTSNGSGAGSFTSPVLTAANNGQTLQITSIAYSTVPNCSQAFTANLTLSVSPVSTVGAVSSDETICPGPPSDISISSATGTIQWQRANDFAFTSGVTNIGTNNLTLTSAQIGSLSATRYFRAVVTSGVCPPVISGVVTVTVVNTPNMPSATRSPNVANICAGELLTVINPVDNGGGTGTCNLQYRFNDGSGWSVWSTTIPTFAASAGLNRLQVRKICDGLNCGISDENEYTWNGVNPPTIADAGDDLNQCNNSTFTVNGNTPDFGNGTWSIISGPGSISTNPNLPTVTVTGVTAGSSTVLRWTIASPPCTASFDDVVLTNFALPTIANAGADDEICFGDIKTLTANNPTAGTGLWTWSGPGSVNYVNSTTASQHNAQVSFSAAGTYTGTWTVSNGPCTPSVDQVEITVLSSATNVILVDGTTAFAATERCVESDGWTYYATADDPDEYIFGIKKNGNVFDAVVEIVDLPGTTTISQVSGVGPARGTFLIGRYWNVNILSGSIATDVDIRFFVDPAEVTQAFNEADALLNSTALPGSAMTPLTFFKAPVNFNPSMMNNGNFAFVPDNTWANPTSGSINGVTYYEMGGITSFSGGTGGYSVNDGAPLLPVELMSFTATSVENRYVRLDWSTATEINNEGFEVQRSLDGINFETIGWVEGNGNSVVINTYSYNDMEAVSGINYYRLKQIDFDGEFEYTYIVSARLTGVDKLQVENVRPNPAENEIYIDVDTRVDVRTTFTIYNHMGQQVDKFSRVLTEGRNEVKVNTSKYAAGAYYVTIENNNAVVTKKFVISR